MKPNKLLIASMSILLLQPLSTVAMTKKETVYVQLKNDGTPIKTTVNNHLFLTSEDKKITDQSILKNITNTSGDETFEQKNNILTFENKGKDIFYQGTTEKTSPIQMKVKYYLDDKEMAVKDMIGKKGTVKIEINYENEAVDGTTYPFVVTTATILKDKDNKEITISNGKAIDTGSKTIIVGIAAPSLDKITNMSDFSNLNSTEITYQTENFSLNNIYMIATPKLLSEEDFTIFDKVDTLTSSIATMDASVGKLIEGSTKLQDGSKTLEDGLQTLQEKLQQINAATEQLENGTIRLDAGLAQMMEKLQNVKASLESKDMSEKLSKIDYLLSQYETTINTLTTTNQILKTTYDTYQLAAFQTTEALSTYFSNYFEQKGLTKEEYQSKIEELIKCKITYEAIYSSNQNLITLLASNKETITTLKASVIELTTSITDLLEQSQTGILTLQEGSKTLKNGMSQVNAGAKALQEGASTLTQGQATLGNGIASLTTGLTTFDNQAMTPLTTYANKIATYKDTLEKVTNLSNTYKGFSTDNATMTTFVYKMQAAK